MKVRIVYILFVIISVSIVFSSYKEGPAQHSGWDCSGGESDFSNPTGCTTGGGCHASSATSGILVVLELDSAGVPVTSYKGGQTYTVKITGTNTTANTLPAFGFQITSTVGTTELATPTIAGAWGTPPANTHVSAPSANNYSLSVFEHGTALSPATGTGDSGTIYTDSITWTAPAVGTGSISLWAALNAVDNNGSADAGDHWNMTHLVITEDTTATNTGVTSVSPFGKTSAYPNPVTDMINLQWDNAQAGSGILSVYNVTGQLVRSKKIDINSGAGHYSLSTLDWTPGVYLINLQNGTANNAFRILKQ